MPAADEGLQALLEGDAVPDETALQDALARFERVHQAFQAVRSRLAKPDVPAATVAAFLTVADRVAPDSARLPEGTSLAVRHASAPELRAVLMEGSTAVRYGGPGIETVLAVVDAAQGWSLDRVMRGATSRERREDAALGALADAAERLWRVRLSRGETTATVFVVGEDTPEVRAAAARLVARLKAPAAAVVPDSAAEWYATLDGPAATSVEGVPEALG